MVDNDSEHGVCKQGQAIEGAGSGSFKVGRIAEEEKQIEKIGGLVAVSPDWDKLNHGLPN